MKRLLIAIVAWCNTMLRYVYIVLFVSLLSVSCGNPQKAKIEQIEHIYICTDDAPVLFELLHRQLGLPVVWAYQSWGDFTSGGVSLGNVVLEVIQKEANDTDQAYGIALSPNMEVASVLPTLDSLEILHGKVAQGEAWSTLRLRDLMPKYIDLFICDYHDRSLVKANRTKASEALQEVGKNYLGIQKVNAIVVTASNPEVFKSKLKKLPSVRLKNDHICFSQGPSLQMIASDQPAFHIHALVSSLEKVKAMGRQVGELKVTKEGVALTLDQKEGVVLYLAEMPK